MNLPCRNPAFVIVILWGIAIVMTAFLFIGSPNLVYGIVIQGICMIGSVTYIKKVKQWYARPPDSTGLIMLQPVAPQYICQRSREHCKNY